MEEIIKHMKFLSENVFAMDEDLTQLEQQSSKYRQTIDELRVEQYEMIAKSEQLRLLIDEKREPEVLKNFPAVLDELEGKLETLKVRQRQKQQVTAFTSALLIMLLVLLLKVLFNFIFP